MKSLSTFAADIVNRQWFKTIIICLILFSAVLVGVETYSSLAGPHKALLHVIDYVIVHELAHLSEMNHSRRFWERVGSVLPDYTVRRKWLRENGHRLCL